MWLEPARSVHDEVGRKLPVPVVVFADIDESFLTPKPLSMTGGAEDILVRERVGLTLCSNMTRAEIEMIQQELELRSRSFAKAGGRADPRWLLFVRGPLRSSSSGLPRHRVRAAVRGGGRGPASNG